MLVREHRLSCTRNLLLNIVVLNATKCRKTGAIRTIAPGFGH